MPASDRGQARVLVLLSVAIVVTIVAAVLSVFSIHHLSSDSSRSDERTQVATAAGQLAVDFTSVDYRNLTADFAATAKHATPSFAKSYLATVKTFEPLYRKGKVVQTTTVDSAGIQKLSATSAQVLVALAGRATNTATPNGSVQLFRMQVDLQKVNGAWLASNVQPL